MAQQTFTTRSGKQITVWTDMEELKAQTDALREIIAKAIIAEGGMNLTPEGIEKVAEYVATHYTTHLIDLRPIPNGDQKPIPAWLFVEDSFKIGQLIAERYDLDRDLKAVADAHLAS